MYITVQFKDAQKNFRGRTYDYEVYEDEPTLTKGDIIRMMDNDLNYICNGTRVKVVDVKNTSTTALTKIRVLKTSLD